jgi:predicted Abi (CAAX) family protease
LRWRTGSLWPAVLLHWLEVAGWQIWFGGGMLFGTT